MRLLLDRHHGSAAPQLEAMGQGRESGNSCNGGKGRWWRTGEQDRRFREAGKTPGRAQILRAAGAATGARLQRCSPTATALRGAAGTGISDGKVHQLRIQATKAQGKLPKGVEADLGPREVEDGSAKDPGVLAAAEAAR